MNREVPFDPKAICDGCGARGAFDFMGDLLCPKCADGAVDTVDEDGEDEEAEDAAKERHYDFI